MSAEFNKVAKLFDLRSSKQNQEASLGQRRLKGTADHQGTENYARRDPDVQLECIAPTPPRTLDVQEQAWWDYLCEMRQASKVLKPADGPVLLSLVEALVDYYRVRAEAKATGPFYTTEKGEYKQTDPWRVLPVFHARVMAILKAAMMTPAEIRKFTFPVPQGGDNSFADF